MDFNLPLKKKELEDYTYVSRLTWGATPYDVSWAIGTTIFKDKAKELNVETFNDVKFQTIK